MSKVLEMMECPLMKKKIESYICFEIQTVVNETSPAFVAPKEIFENKNYKNICKSCKYFRKD